MGTSIQPGNIVIYSGPLAQYTGKIAKVESVEDVFTNKAETLFSLRIKKDIDSPFTAIAAYDRGIHPLLLNDTNIPKLGFTFNSDNGLFELEPLFIVTQPGSLDRYADGRLVYKRHLYLIFNSPESPQKPVSFVSDIQNYSKEVLGEDILSDLAETLIGVESKGFQGY